MTLIGGYFGALLLRIPVLLAYLAGVIISLVLSTRHKDAPAYLALAGFVVLFIINLLSSFTPLLPYVLRGGGMTMSNVGILSAALNLLLNLGATAGVVCLILALWRGLGR